MIDNVTRKLGQVSLAALLTARTWRDRLLGKSKTVEVPNRTLWIVTGNNVGMNDEMARRSVRIRLDAGVEEPWHRQGFKHDSLLEWADEHRGELVWAALVLVANWLARGAQPFTERTLGSFEPWARVVGGVLRDVGIEGFLQGRQRMHSEADRDSACWATFPSSDRLGLVSTAREQRRGDIERLDLLGQSAIAQDTEPRDPNFVVGPERDVE